MIDAIKSMSWASGRKKGQEQDIDSNRGMERESEQRGGESWEEEGE